MTKKQKKMLYRIIAALALVLVLKLLPPLPASVELLLYCIPYLVVGWDVLHKALLGIKNRQPFDECFLMAVATVGAFALGDYVEGCAVIIFYQIGELFQGVAVGKSRRSISALMDIRPDYANIEGVEVIEENPNLCGLNVTIPYKEQVIPYLDELDKDTAKIGAVNVIKIIRLPKGKVKLVGYNSDIIGFTQSIEPLLQPQHKKALILGTGGASKAVYRGLENLSIKSTFVSRAKKEDKYLTYEELTPKIMQEYTVIVNCTPVGMYPKVDFRSKSVV